MNEKYLSLFEYLKRPAGGELGKQVFEKAKLNKVKVNSKEVTTKKYSGKVLTYPESFLIDYFEKH